MSPSRVWLVSRYGQRMIHLPAGWPPLFSFEWWSGIGTGLLSFTAAVLIGATTATVAIRSHLLAQRVAKAAEEQSESAREERYRDQLWVAVESAITSIVEYGNAVEQRGAMRGTERQLHAAATARLVLVDATARGEDKRPTRAAYEVFHEVGHHPMYRVRQNVAGLIAGALAQTLARQLSPSSIESNIRGLIEAEEDEYKPS